MANLLKLIIYFFLINNAVEAYNTGRHMPINFAVCDTPISPEILNELKDFKNLIPRSIIDEIVAKHYFIDGNFRKASKYLRSKEFTQLQRQVLNLPEVVNILEFLHLTNATTTTRHMGATTAETITSDAVKASFEQEDSNAMTTNTDLNSKKVNSIANVEETLNNKKMLYKRPHMSVPFNSVDEGITSSFNLQQALVSIVLLEDSTTKTNAYDVAAYNADHYQQPFAKYGRYINNNYHHHQHEHYQSLGTFTDFVEEVLQHLPHAEYQNMIKEKCQENAKFADFYQALRSQELKALVEQTMETTNIKKVIKTLNSHDVDVAALKPIAFQVIAWGPNI